VTRSELPIGNTTILDTTCEDLGSAEVHDLALPATGDFHNFAVWAFVYGAAPQMLAHVHVVTLDGLTVCDANDSNNTVTRSGDSIQN
jgi:hypothetical protein